MRCASSDAKKLKKTLVYEENVKLGGVMVRSTILRYDCRFEEAFSLIQIKIDIAFCVQVDFADYLMPVQYKDSPKAQSIIDSTKHCREKAGLFDVSHMCSIRWRGKVVFQWIGTSFKRICL